MTAEDLRSVIYVRRCASLLLLVFMPPTPRLLHLFEEECLSLAFSGTSVLTARPAVCRHAESLRSDSGHPEAVLRGQEDARPGPNARAVRAPALALRSLLAPPLGFLSAAPDSGRSDHVWQSTIQSRPQLRREVLEREVPALADRHGPPRLSGGSQGAHSKGARHRFTSMSDVGS